jgi:hypothetical protein
MELKVKIIPYYIIELSDNDPTKLIEESKNFPEKFKGALKSNTSNDKLIVKYK